MKRNKKKTIIWERLEISLRKLKIPREHFNAKMGTIKDKNGMDLTEAKDIKKWQDCTEECTKMILTTQIITMV